MAPDTPTLASDASVNGAVVMADISGSTPLYERAGNEAAAAAINARIALMRDAVDRYEGTFVSAKGDDVLCWFENPSQAVEAAYAMAAMKDDAGLTVHAGAQWGRFVQHSGDIFGACVNEAARLCSLAKSGEIVIGESLYNALPATSRGGLVEMSAVRLKGVETQMRIFSRQVETPGANPNRTVIGEVLYHQTQRPQVLVDAHFAYDGNVWKLETSRPLSVGRSPSNVISIGAMTISREHGTITLNDGLVEFTDHSSSGTYIVLADGQEISVFRRSVALNGEGSISLGAPHGSSAETIVQFRISSGST